MNAVDHLEMQVAAAVQMVAMVVKMVLIKEPLELVKEQLHASLEAQQERYMPLEALAVEDL